MKTDLPKPSPEAAEHSRQLSLLLKHNISTSKEGYLAFDHFMDMALYEPGFGYYSTGNIKFGEAGDFITAPGLSPLFSRYIAHQLIAVLSSVERPRILEFGAGTGCMAVNILTELQQCGILPERYLILELSSELKARQKALINEKIPDMASLVQWVSGVPPKFQGAIVANEVLDAMPVSRFRITEDGIQEQVVKLTDDAQFRTDFVPASANLKNSVEALSLQMGGHVFAPGYQSEINPRLPGWMHLVSRGLEKGLVLLVDYGYSAKEYYLAQRNKGTLMCHYRHRAHNDFFWYPGLQDITAHVDFSAVAEAASSNGLQVLGYTPQAFFLFGNGLQEMLEALDPDDVQNFLKVSEQVKTLTLPGDMGERFKVMALGRDVDMPLSGFEMRDFRDRL
ncbi:MAG: SAM-dependent methyltransferase [gamma proteobacterium symbiont of Bathyaustriella thionipta]|nr:SAM-dependent methyltransferase [gamma proteobacterium symbiont of Bathyaustriella thionipta]